MGGDDQDKVQQTMEDYLTYFARPKPGMCKFLNRNESPCPHKALKWGYCRKHLDNKRVRKELINSGIIEEEEIPETPFKDLDTSKLSDEIEAVITQNRQLKEQIEKLEKDREEWMGKTVGWKFHLENKRHLEDRIDILVTACYDKDTKIDKLKGRISHLEKYGSEK